MISRIQLTKKWAHTTSALPPRGGRGSPLSNISQIPSAPCRAGRRAVARNALPLKGSKIARRRRKAVPMGKHTANAATGVVGANKGLKQGATAGSVATRFPLTDKKGCLRVQRAAECSNSAPLYQQKKSWRFLLPGVSVFGSGLEEGGGTLLFVSRETLCACIKR